MGEPSGESWPEVAAREAAAQLPPVRDDEPASLRRDILDELADHLACAYRRELLRTEGDAARAEANVRRRFGDPGRVARRLWFDAMKGRLMVQKVLVGTCAALVAACVLFGLLLWRAVGEMQASNAALVRQSQEANAALLAQARQANAAALEQMRKLGTAPAASDPEWNPVVVRLVSGAKGGPPAQGLTVRLEATVKDQTSPKETVGPTGVADFGLMRPGPYRLSVETPWGESLSRDFQIRPGRAVDLTVVCPAREPETVPVAWDVRWPEAAADLDSPDDLWCLALVQGGRSRNLAGDEWHVSALSLLAFHRDGRVIDLTAIKQSDIPPELSQDEDVYRFATRFLGDFPGRPTPGRVRAGGVYETYEIGLARWNGEGSPLRLLTDPIRPTVKYANHIAQSLNDSGTIGYALLLHRPRPQWTAPLQGTARWTLDIHSGLVAWEERLDEDRRARQAGQRERRLDWPDVLKLFDQAEPVAPVEALRPGQVARSAVDRWPPLPVSFVFRAGENGAPLEGVGVQLTRKDVPGDVVGDVGKSGPDGLVDFGRLAQARYHFWLTLPWRESASDDLAVFSERDRLLEHAGPFLTPSDGSADLPELDRRPVICPAGPPPTVPVRWSVTWPAAARRKSDLWVLLELSGRAQRFVGERSWYSNDWRLVALHPDGRALVWARNGDRWFSFHEVQGLPDLLAKLTPGHPPAGAADELLKGGKYAALGVGIARWDGTGDASQLLRGVRDGRYGETHGAFHSVFRELVPMKADANLPKVALQDGEEAATASFAVPESLVAAALRRWEAVPKVVKQTPGAKRPAGG